MILSLFITFFTTRIILQNLGVNDFGIYNLVAGAISLLGFFNGSMANTVQRFFAYELGCGNLAKLKNAFSLSFSFHIAISIILLILLEVFGTFLFDYVFVIDENRITAAKIAYQLMIFTTALSTIASPLDACFYAHEHIFIIAIIDLITTVLKLAAAFILLYSSYDNLIIYSLLILLIQILVTSTKYVICRYKYVECQNGLSFNNDRNLVKEIFPFLGWNMMESFSWLGKNQGIAVLMNSFYGTVINAAYGVANQVNGQVMFFSSTLLNAIRPQIYKAGGAKENDKMLLLSTTASKFAFFVLLIIVVPLFPLLGQILKIWLRNVPAYTERICMLLLLITLINYLSIGINIAIQAYGEVKLYQIVSSLIILGALPLAYGISSTSDNVYLFLYVMLIVELISVLIKYYIASKVLQKKYSFFLKNILLPCLIIAITSMTFSNFLHGLLAPDLSFSTATLFTITCITATCGVIYISGLTHKEKALINSLMLTLRKRLINR